MKKITKITISLLFANMLLFGASLTSYAAGGKVIYDGKDKKIVIETGTKNQDEYTVSDLFGDEFKNLLPGDTRVIEDITIESKCGAGKYVKCYLYPKGPAKIDDGVIVGNDEEGDVFTEKEVYQALLSQIIMKVEHNGKVLVDDTADSVNYADAGLDCGVYLGTLNNNEKTNLKLTVNVPLEFKAPEGIEPGTVEYDNFQNSFADKAGLIEWEIKFEEYDDSSPIPPDTRDITHIRMYTFVSIASVVVIIVLIFIKKKKEDKTN